MEIAPIRSASLFLCCALSSITAAQQIESRDQVNQPPIASVADRFRLFAPSEGRETASPSPLTGSVPAGEALRRRLLSLRTEPLSRQSGSQFLTFDQRFALKPLSWGDGRYQTKATLKGLSSIYVTAYHQRIRFRETGQPMGFERNGVYFRRDLYSITKGLILHRFWDDRVDIGLYKRRYQGASLLSGQSIVGFGMADAINHNRGSRSERQVFVGVRLKLDRIF